jgi:hypothetical protein
MTGPDGKGPNILKFIKNMHGQPSSVLRNEPDVRVSFADVDDVDKDRCEYGGQSIYYQPLLSLDYSGLRHNVHKKRGVKQSSRCNEILESTADPSSGLE